MRICALCRSCGLFHSAFLVAKMLDDHIVYSDIVAKTGASTATISRVNRSLNYGNDGYRIVFERLEKDHEL